MEGYFGVIDNIVNTNSCNLSFHAASGLACWSANNTGYWMETALTTEQRAVFVKLARYNKNKFKREVKSQIAAVAAARAATKVTHWTLMWWFGLRGRMKQGQGACEQMHCMYTHVQASEAAHRRERLRAKITSSLALQKDAHSLKQQLTVKYFEEIVVPPLCAR